MQGERLPFLRKKYSALNILWSYPKVFRDSSVILFFYRYDIAPRIIG